MVSVVDKQVASPCICPYGNSITHFAPLLYIVVPDMLGSSDITSVLSRTHIVSANMVVGKRKITANKNFFIFILLRLEKRPPEKYGGQEVQNNQMNCVAYSIYSQTLLTIKAGVFCHFFVTHLTGSDTPSLEYPTTRLLYNKVFRIDIKKSPFRGFFIQCNN